MTNIPDAVWIRIAKAAGGLPDAARDEVTAAIRSCQEYDGIEFLRVSLDTREMVTRALTNAAELSKTLEALELNKEFRSFNTQGQPVDVTDLAETRAWIDQLHTKLLDHKKRLSKRSMKNWERLNVIALVVPLLEIRADYLGINVPLGVKEDASSGRFTEYLGLCLKQAHPELTPDELKGQIHEALLMATQGFRETRGWKHENFPKDHEPSVKKND